MDQELSSLQSLRIKFGTQICLRNMVTGKYFQYDILKQTANAQAPPPIVNIPQRQSTAFAKGNQAILKMFKKTSYSKYKIIQASISTTNKIPNIIHTSLNKTQSQKNNQLKDYLCYGNKVHLLNQHGQYLTSSSKNQLKFDKPTIDQKLNNGLFVSATFIINDAKNSSIIGQRPITVYDNITLKNVFGKNITVLQDLKTVNISGDKASNNVLWNVMKADVPYIPLYIYTDSVLGKFLFLQNDRDKRGFEQSQRKRVKKLADQTQPVQQALLVQDILDVMLGFDGIYIKRRQGTQHFIIEPHLQNPSCSVALTQMCYKILDVPAYYYVVENYVAYYSLQQGTVCQALCCGLRHIIKQYKMMVIQLDQQASQQGLTLQKMWFKVQQPLKVIKAIYQLVKQVDGLKGGNLISCINKFLHLTTDQQIAKIYNFLFGKTMKVYIEMISKWIYSGVIEDKYKQFLVKDQDQDIMSQINKVQANQWTSWERKYTLRENQIPTIFQNNAQKILITGKYLNIMKQCNKMPDHPFKGQIMESQKLKKSIQMQDFTHIIEKAYEWTSEQIHNLIFEKCKLKDVLKSMKGYFFMEFGDLFIQFMQVADKQLTQLKAGIKYVNKLDKKHQPVSVQKLQNLFQLLIRTSSANSDPFKEQISCKIDSQSLYEQIHKIKTLQPQTFNYDYSDKTYVKTQSRYLDFFTLDFECSFPLNLIINKRTISKYQILFRYLFWAKFMEKQMNKLWLDLQGLKLTKIESIKVACGLNQRMINFSKNLFYYLSFQIIERNWIQFMQNLQKAKTFEQIIKMHDDFLNKCLKQTLTTNKILFPLITIDIGNTYKSFNSIQNFIEVINNIKNNINADERMPKQGILTRNRNRQRQFQQDVLRKANELDLKTQINSYSERFDNEIRKLLRQIYAMVNNQQNHLVGLLDRLDQQKYYNRKFGGQMNMHNQIIGSYHLM